MTTPAQTATKDIEAAEMAAEIEITERIAQLIIKLLTDNFC